MLSEGRQKFYLCHCIQVGFVLTGFCTLYFTFRSHSSLVECFSPSQHSFSLNLFSDFLTSFFIFYFFITYVTIITPFSWVIKQNPLIAKVSFYKVQCFCERKKTHMNMWSRKWANFNFFGNHAVFCMDSVAVKKEVFCLFCWLVVFCFCFLNES